MIGLGLDLCEIARMEKLLEKGDGFLKRYFTPQEQAYILGRGQTAAHSMAAHFAAKEAFLKAIGTGIGSGLTLMDVSVTHTPAGQPCYVLSPAAQEKLTSLGATRTHLSLSHEAGMAAAVAIIE